MSANEPAPTMSTQVQNFGELNNQALMQSMAAQTASNVAPQQYAHEESKQPALLFTTNIADAAAKAADTKTSMAAASAAYQTGDHGVSFTIEKTGGGNIQEEAADAALMQPISDKLFYKEMAKIKENSKQTGGGILPPKKSASAYIIFQKEKRPEILQKNPKAKVTEVVKEIARCWSLMSKEDRMVYKMEAKRDKERYERELKQLESQSTSIKKPKKCLSAYMIFVKETRPKIVSGNPDMGALEVMQEVGRAWQSMTEADRKYFKDKADNDKHRYLAESRKFYDEVARIGIQNNAAEQEEIGAEKEAQEASGAEEEAALAGKKRLAGANSGGGRKGIKRSQSMTGNSQPSNNNASNQPTKRQATAAAMNANNQVMAMGLAPSSPDFQANQPNNSSAQKRLRAESKFTFKPDELSDENGDGNENGSQIGFENEEDEEDENDDGDLNGDEFEGLSNDGKPPETAIQFFATEFKPCLERDFANLRPQALKQAIKKRWNELTMKQKCPFEQLAHQIKLKREEKTTSKGRGSKAKANQAQQQATTGISQLSRANQKLAKEALVISDSLATELQASLEQQNNADGGATSGLNGQQDDLVQANNQDLIKGVDDGQNAGKQLGNELDMGVNGQNMIDMDALSAQRGGWQSGLNRFNTSLGTPSPNTHNINLQNQHFANQAALTQAFLQNQYLNPLSANLLQNSTQNNSHMLMGHQNSNDNLNFDSTLGTTNNNGIDQLQQQQILAAQIANNPQQQAVNQQQLLLFMAQQNMMNPNIGFLNQQAAFQQLQNQTPQQQALLNQMFFGKMAALGGQGQLNAFGMFDSTATSQTNNQMMSSLLKQPNETPTPQFAGTAADIDYDNEMNLLPSAATHPNSNIFYPMNSTIDEHIGGGFGSSGMQPGHATPNQTAAFNSLFNSHEFQLPASAHQTSNYHMGGGNTESVVNNHQQTLFGHDNSNKHGHGHHTLLQNHGVGGQNHVVGSPLVSPQIRAAINQNDDHSQSKLYMWQQGLFKNNMPKVPSAANILSQASAQKAFQNTGCNTSGNNLNNQQTTSTGCSQNAFLNPLKDQQQCQQQQAQTAVSQNLYSTAANGATGANTLQNATNNNDMQLNSTSVTPYLKPTQRNPETSGMHMLSSPFLKGHVAPTPHYPQFNFGQILGQPSGLNQLHQMHQTNNGNGGNTNNGGNGGYGSMLSSGQNQQQQGSQPLQQQQQMMPNSGSSPYSGNFYGQSQNQNNGGGNGHTLNTSNGSSQNGLEKLKFI